MNFDIDETLCRREVPPRESLLTPDFSEKFGLGKIHQLGLAVPDIVEAAKRLEKCGVGPFFIAEDGLDMWIERGESRHFHGKMGIGYIGDYELELLEEGSGSTFYSEFFRDDGGIALHHVGFLDHGVDEKVLEMNEAGIDTGVRGRIKLGLLTIDFAYMDARAETGLYVEFLDYRLAGVAISPSKLLMKTGARVLKHTGIGQLRMGRRD